MVKIRSGVVVPGAQGPRAYDPRRTRTPHGPSGGVVPRMRGILQGAQGVTAELLEHCAKERAKESLACDGDGRLPLDLAVGGGTPLSLRHRIDGLKTGAENAHG